MKEKWELKGQMVRNRVDQYRKYRIPIYRHQNTGKYRYTGIFNMFF
jgi:hypothetical protein